MATASVATALNRSRLLHPEGRVSEKRQPITEARLEAALLQSAELLKQFPFVQPIYKRLMDEKIARISDDPVARARSLLRTESHAHS